LGGGGSVPRWGVRSFGGSSSQGGADAAGAAGDADEADDAADVAGAAGVDDAEARAGEVDVRLGAGRAEEDGADDLAPFGGLDAASAAETARMGWAVTSRIRGRGGSRGASSGGIGSAARGDGESGRNVGEAKVGEGGRPAHAPTAIEPIAAASAVDRICQG
jgi:hypothetical protein